MTESSLLVCGTGLAGLAAALGLRRAGFKVSLLGPEPRPDPAPGDTYHPRVYAISPGSQAFLDDMGVWPLMTPARITPVDGMDVYGDADGVVHLHAWQAAQTALAWIVESGELERALWQAVRVYGIRLETGRFVGIDSGRAMTESGRALSFDLMVGADGANSPVRAAAGIRHHRKPYGDTGIVAHIDAEFAHQGIAMQWFTGDSILALLPLPDTAHGAQVSMVWSMPQAEAQPLLAMDDDARRQTLEQRLRAVTGGRLGRLRLRSEPLGFPLTLEGSDMIAPGVALVGDAAHRVHPLAGQGLNLGLGDIRELIRVLEHKEAWRGPGDMRVLARYRRARAEPVLAMSLATHGLHGLFAQRAAPVALLRNLGMRWVDRSAFIKRMLIAGAR